MSSQRLRRASQRRSALPTLPMSSSMTLRSGTTLPGWARPCAAVDPLVAALSAQARGFTAANRRALLALLGELIASIIPRFRALSDAGRCELSLTPYAHPLLPLLIDFGAARQAQPTAALPRHSRYPGGTERAAWHVREGIRVFTAAFGKRPVGCWPSEGAISDATLELIEQFEFRWAASSANVLRASLGASAQGCGAASTVRTALLRGGSTAFSATIRSPILSASATPAGAAMMPRRIWCRSLWPRAAAGWRSRARRLDCA